MRGFLGGVVLGLLVAAVVLAAASLVADDLPSAAAPTEPEVVVEPRAEPASEPAEPAASGASEAAPELGSEPESGAADATPIDAGDDATVIEETVPVLPLEPEGEVEEAPSTDG